MSDRIDDFLEGRLERHALSDAERAEADAIRRAADDVRTFLSARPAPDVTAGVLRGIEGTAPAGARPHRPLAALIRRMWSPVPIAVRPVYALAAVVLLFVYAGTDGSRRGAAGPDGPPLFVQFRLDADASRVQLAGSFTNWEQRYELRQIAPGHWSVTLPLTEGVHDYAFLVDGEQWVADPYAAQVRDGFGGINSRLTLLLPGEPSSAS